LGLDRGADGMFSYSLSTILRPPCSSLPNTASHDEVGDLSGLVVLAEHPGLAGLASLGFELTNRPLLPGNRITPLIDGDEAYPRMLEAIRGTECYDEELAAHLTAIAEAKRKESKPLTLEAM